MIHVGHPEPRTVYEYAMSLSEWEHEPVGKISIKDITSVKLPGNTSLSTLKHQALVKDGGASKTTGA